MTGRKVVKGVRILVSTRKGLFIYESDRRRSAWKRRGPYLEGQEVFHSAIDPRDGKTLYAAVNGWMKGAVWKTTNLGRTWDVSPIPTKKIWSISFGHSSEPGTVYAGGMPAALYKSVDSGGSWKEVRSLTRQPSRKEWMPGAGGLCLHTILQDPLDLDRLYVAISAVGAFVTRNGGKTWKPINEGVTSLAVEMGMKKQRFPQIHRCVHKMALHSTRPGALYQQNHMGVYRTAGWDRKWRKISSGLSSEFGMALAVHPREGETIFVVPIASGMLHWAPRARLAVYRSRDGGKKWKRLSRGLPQGDAWLNVLRDALCTDTLDPVGVYFGTNTGQLYASRNEGDAWKPILEYLPPITAVTASPIYR
ncbi:MAG: exo-alpha-sialidase [Planctomycetota bacterium]|nr:exo-alpha-sialidase [Planctomycetota bacterium]